MQNPLAKLEFLNARAHDCSHTLTFIFIPTLAKARIIDEVGTAVQENRKVVCVRTECTSDGAEGFPNYHMSFIANRN